VQKLTFANYFHVDLILSKKLYGIKAFWDDTKSFTKKGRICGGKKERKTPVN
jgi:hypothetical protein